MVILFILFNCADCLQNKKHDARKLKKASWSKLGKGVDYISLKDNKTESSDSIHFTVKGFLGTDITISGNALNELQPILDTTLGRLLNTDLINSKHGYLKIDFYKMIDPEILPAMAYLNDTIDSTELSSSLIKIKEIKGVKKATYISKDMAKKKYLADGNENWEKVLESNPLPATIEIEFDKKIITPEYYESFKTKISDQLILNTIDIFIPSDLLKKFEGNYYILEYNRY